MTLRLAYGYQHWTTAVHLEHALARRTDVVTVGPGHAAADDRVWPLLWVESGVPWVPSPSAIARAMSAAYLIDTHRGYRWRARLAHAFDFAFTAQRPAAERLASQGMPAAWLPLAAPKDLCGPGPDFADRAYDVAFVGQAPSGSFRAALLDAARARFSVAPVEGRLEPAAMMDVYRSARVVLNDPVSGDLNMRAFEAPGARSLQVTVDVPGLRDLVPASAYALVAHRNVDEWLRAVDATLRDPTAPQRADAAYAEIMANHTYDNRAGEVLARLENGSRRAIASQRRAGALAAAWARWNQPDEIARLGLRPPRTLLYRGEAFAWGAASAAVRVRRRLKNSP
ncbi:MAG TPA: glycosyltransferase [Acidimicrobiales bacterium]|nr:glycosyltransferase [Acidimicrobiales bacterium]